MLARNQHGHAIRLCVSSPFLVRFTSRYPYSLKPAQNQPSLASSPVSPHFLKIKPTASTQKPQPTRWFHWRVSFLKRRVVQRVNTGRVVLRVGVGVWHGGVSSR